MKKSLKILILVFAAAGAWGLSQNVTRGAEITESTVISVDTLYNACGHKTSEELRPPKEMVGKSAEEAAKSMGCKAEFNNSGTVLFLKKSETFCPAHYLVKLEDDGTISVFSLQSGEKTDTYPALPTQFSEKDSKLLREGIRADSPAELSAIIEDYTS